MTTVNPLPHGERNASREDVVVWALNAFVGALGVAIGLLAPDRAIEPALGFVMLLFVAATVASERRHRRCLAAEPPLADD